MLSSSTFPELQRQELEQACVPLLERSPARQPPSRVLHYLAWAQATLCVVFLLLVVVHKDGQLNGAPVKKAHKIVQPCNSTDTYSSKPANVPRLPQLLVKQCLPVMVCSMLSKSHSIASLHVRHCDDSSPGWHYSGLLSICTVAAARYSLLLLDGLGLLLAVALLHLTWPRDVHTAVPALAWVPTGMLPADYQHLRRGLQSEHDSADSGSVDSCQGPGSSSASKDGSPVAATAAAGQPAADTGGHWFVVKGSADALVCRRSRWIEAILLLYLFLAAALTWVLLSH